MSSGLGAPRVLILTFEIERVCRRAILVGDRGRGPCRGGAKTC